MYRDEAYRAFVRQHPCEVCGRAADVAHHFGKRIGGGGMGLKPHDTFEVPLCTSCHHAEHNAVRDTDEQERVERRFLVRALLLVTEWLENGKARKKTRKA